MSNNNRLTIVTGDEHLGVIPIRRLVPINQRAPVLRPFFTPVIHNQNHHQRHRGHNTNINPIPNNVIDRTRHQRPSGIVNGRRSPDAIRLEPISITRPQRIQISRSSSGPETNTSYRR